MGGGFDRCSEAPLVSRSERKVVIVVGRRLVDGGFRAEPCESLSSGARAAGRRNRVGTRRSVARRPDNSFTPRATSLFRTVAALEVGSFGIALRRSIVPHRTAADRTGGHSRRHGADRVRGRRDAGDRGCGAARRPDHPIATTILALEVGSAGIPFPLAIVPHRARAAGAIRDRGRIGRLLLFGHDGRGWTMAREPMLQHRGLSMPAPLSVRRGGGAARARLSAREDGAVGILP